MPTSRSSALTRVVAEVLDAAADELIAVRRDLHAHPELSWAEIRTSDLLAQRVEKAGWRVTRLPGAGFAADRGEGGGLVALRADLDALPVTDATDDPWRSIEPGVAHACGHDVHATALLGAALGLGAAYDAGLVDGRVRLLFQPAEEVMPGGALEMVRQGLTDGVERVFALHCDPGVDVGRVGLRLGALTSATDQIAVRLTGTGGHTSRPHLTGDLTFALAKVVTELPGVLSRRMDPRAGVSVVWGVVRAGAAPNVIPGSGLVSGTVRILDAVAWADCEGLIRELVPEIVRPYGVTAHVDYQRGVPPVVNDLVSHQVLADTVDDVLGEGAQVVAPQSLGGEDFGWYLDTIPGAMMRLGTRTPGGPSYDLHQGDLRVDERCIGIGARLLAGAAARALAEQDTGPGTAS